MAARVAVQVEADVADAHTLRPLLERAVRATLSAHDVAEAEVSVTLLEDARIAELNRAYLGREGPTDVIAFSLHAEGEPVLGDVYIGTPQAIRQARELNVPLDQELARLAVHGCLHVLGYDHEEGEEREQGEMWRVQERILSELRR